MIAELRIESLGVIASATVSPGPGFTALTGETGAGKTMVLTALEMLLGGRVSQAIAESAAIEGIWEVPGGHPAIELVAQAGGLVEDGEIVLGRTSAGGRLRAFAGGRMVPAALLSEIGDLLVTVHGQSTQQRLRGPAAQRDALDRFGGVDQQTVLDRYREAFRTWRVAHERLASAAQDAQQTAQRMVFLRSALEDIEKVDPQPGETGQLRTEQHRLANLADLSAATSAAGQALLGTDDGDVPGAADLLHTAARALQDADSGLYDRLVAVAEEASDIGREAASLLDGLADDPGRLDWINQRLHDLAQLQSRYGDSEEAVLEWSRRAAAELVELERGSDVEALKAEEESARESLRTAADALTAAREDLAARLATEVSGELRQLAMPNASLTVSLTRVEPGPDGADDVAFLLAAHPGATRAPISKAASGGELSRIMLALEVVLADPDTRTFVFDEVDAGVGGAAATAIGRRLSQLAERAQVMVVTHMPQVAAFADTHLRVLKQQDADVTVTDVHVLDDDERVVEIARMLAGQEESVAARDHARELLAMRSRQR